MMEETREDALIPFESNFLPWRVRRTKEEGGRKGKTRGREREE